MKTFKNVFRIGLSVLLVIATLFPFGDFGIFKPQNVKAAPLLISDIVGVTHISGRYFLDPNTDFLNEGADKIQDLGTSVIKLWLNNKYDANYPYNSDWSQFGAISSMKQLAQTSYYQNVFNRTQFKTFILEAFEFSNGSSTNWKDGLSQTESDNVYNEFYDLTVYLRSNPAFAGKTFVLQNWEGDNALAADQMTQEQLDIAIPGMIAWLNARQDGITDARNATQGSAVTVVGAAEVNHVNAFGDFTYATVTDYVIPYTHMDLYSWSDWSTTSAGTEWKVTEYLDYIKNKAPDSALYGADNIYLGEFGCYEMTCTGTLIDQHTAASDRIQREIIGKQLELALRWGVKYAVYWEIYCNGLRSGVTITPPEEATEDQLKGVWLIRPDGSYTGTWDYLQSIMSRSLDSYKYTYELENNVTAASSGDSAFDVSDTYMSGRNGNKLTADAAGDYVQYTLYVPQTGYYFVKAGFKKSTGSGIFQLSADGTNTGAETDTYASSVQYTELDLGTVAFETIGNKNFVFTVTGKNAASADYDLVLDYITLVPTQGAMVVVDNTDAGFTFDSPWTASSASQGYFGTNYMHDGTSGADSSSRWAKWTPDITAAGDYDIYMKWTSDSNRPDEAPLEIAYNGGVDTSKTVNQKTNGGVWNYIGRYNLAAGSGNYVKLLATDAGYTVADAVKFERPVTTDDNLNNWNTVYSHTTNWAFASSNPDIFEGDTSRVTRTTNTAENVVYYLANISNFSAKLYYYSTVTGRVKFYTSPDYVTWTELTVTNDTPVSTGSSWYRTNFTPSGAIPAGTNYLKVEFLNDANIWTPQLSQISITHR